MVAGCVFLVGAVLSGEARIKNLNKNSLQADKEIFRIVRQMGGEIFWEDGDLVAKKSSLRAAEIDVSQIPDLAPILAVLLANCEGRSKITGAKRLRFKECDRLEAVSCQFGALGVRVETTADGLAIYGSGNNKSRGFKSPLTLWSHCDHRIAMTISIMALNLKGSVKITDAQCVRKSYPNFFRDYNLLGGKASVVNLG